MVPTTSAELDSFASLYRFTVDADDKAYFLAESFDFLGSLEFCKEPDKNLFVKAQCYLIKELSKGATLSGTADTRIKIEESLGKNSLVDKWKVNEALSGTDSLSRLKTFPMTYSLLKPYLCESSVVVPAAYVV